MRKAIERIEQSNWQTADEVGTVTLPFDGRHRRRIRMTDDAGEPFVLDLAEAVYLHDGDGLRLNHGGIIHVKAAHEPVLNIDCRNPTHTAQIAWHIGNRHIPLQIFADGSLRIRADHVLGDMLTGLGARITKTDAPFSPEPGAYSSTGHGDHEH